MRIVDQARLWFQQGNSDKVYEVELVEVAPGQYVVNFRYGRRGTALRDGTKTPLPINLEQARSVFAAWGAGGDPIQSAIGFANYVSMVDPKRGAEFKKRALALRGK
jgi:hypothetical protein